MKRCKIAAISAYLPERVVSNDELEQLIQPSLTQGILEKLFGIKERRFARADEQVSDLASQAAAPLLESIEPSQIDLLIFAAASADLIEPATANIIQQKLGLQCPAMDIKNACNSFVTALQTASAFIQSGIYQNILIVTGEKLSDAINFKIQDEEHLRRSMAAMSLGDAGTAVLVTPSEDESGLYFQRFMTAGDHWQLCTIQGGGSMHPRDASKNYFEGKTALLKDVILQEAGQFLRESLEASSWESDNIQHLATHQVSMQTFPLIAKAMGIPTEKAIKVFEKYGNTAAASIPLSIYEAWQSGQLQKGDRLAMIGLAAGISASLQLMIW